MHALNRISDERGHLRNGIDICDWNALKLGQELLQFWRIDCLQGLGGHHKTIGRRQSGADHPCQR